ncbi:MAG: hypothetical protein M1827_003295 [Pycnora praestabilis]|nr:MAG: hypothetical protein M1827_003295 [Pycnora praestabilis]
MTRKKKTQSGLSVDNTPSESSASLNGIVPPLREKSGSPAPSISTSSAKTKITEPSTSALIICRNKHWRYISSFHGPWLQLPPEVLESLAHSNYASPRPHPIDPAVFYDLVKIRRLVDEATNLAVRAASGVTSSSLSNALNAGNGILGGGGAAALGLGLGGGNSKLSRERKHRMRELATQKLSHAYHLDEIAASVATMQSASTLEDVANLVLQRSSADSDAKYVHFFHEKIPSRMLAQCTSLRLLDEVIADRPTEGAPLRTRAVTNIFKDDFVSAVRDLTDALAVCRHTLSLHRAGRGQLELANALDGAKRKTGQARDWRQDVKIEEEDQPSSLESQLLFHRAGVYLTLACQYIDTAVDGLKTGDAFDKVSAASSDIESPEQSATEKDADKRRCEARKIVKTNAKRALRDYVSFLSHFDYTPGLSSEMSEEFIRKVNKAANGFTKTKVPPNNRLLEMSGNSNLSNGHLSDTLVPRKSSFSQYQHSNGNGCLDTSYPSIPPPEVHQVSALFSSTPPASLPPYPSTSLTLAPKKQQQHQPHSASSDSTSAAAAYLASSDSHEAITYHPLLTDGLHSLLLCHALIQTSPKELLRHAHNAARLARVCDGYPIFLAARSPARADWIEVVRRAGNWIGLSQSWESLCTPAPLPGHSGEVKKEESEEQKKERRRQEAIMEALADERVHDEESFQAAVRARERRAEELRAEELGPSLGNGNGNAAKRWAQEDGKEYPISTERAEAVARWVREAPVGGMEGAGKARKAKGKVKVRKGHEGNGDGLAYGVEGLSLDGEMGGEVNAEEDIE